MGSATDVLGVVGECAEEQVWSAVRLPCRFLAGASQLQASYSSSRAFLWSLCWRLQSARGWRSSSYAVDLNNSMRRGIPDWLWRECYLCILGCWQYCGKSFRTANSLWADNFIGNPRTDIALSWDCPSRAIRPLVLDRVSGLSKEVRE